MAICYDKHQDDESGIEYTSKSITANPNYQKPYLNRAEKYVKLLKYEEALQGIHLHLYSIIDYQ